MPTNVAAALCYIPLVAIVFLLIEPYKRDKEVRFHAWQSIFLLVGLAILRYLVVVLLSASYGLASALSAIIGLTQLVLIVFLGINAYKNKRMVVPLIGPLAEKQV